MKALSVTLAAAAAAALAFTGAASAQAAGASIDPGDNLYAVTCYASDYNDWQLLSVAPETGLSTKIGNGTGTFTDTACAAQPAYNAVTGKSYYVQFLDDEDPGYYTNLATIDVATGASTTIGPFTYVSGEIPTFPVVDSMAIGTDGSAYVLAEGNLYSVNLGNGDMSFIGESLVDTYAFAVDPTTGLFYAIDDSGKLFRVNVADGSYDSLESVLGTGNIYSLQIDGGGRFWIEADEDSDSGAGLWSFALSDPATPLYSGPFIDGPYYSEALLIIPGAALAATGADLSGAPLIAGGAVLAALLGVGAIVAARRRTI